MNNSYQNGVFVHPQALCESDAVGCNTRIWAFAHVMKGAHIGRECSVGGHTFIESGVVVGDRVTIKNQVLIWYGVTIEEDVFLGPRVAFTNDRFPRSPRVESVPAVVERYRTAEGWCESTLVKRGAAIGAGAVIGPGTTIGCFSLIGMGSVVCCDVPNHALMVGNPARRIGWVCACGKRLPVPEMAQDLRCSCGLVYAVADGMIVLRAG